MFTRAVTNRNLYMDFNTFCHGHCVCVAETEDEKESSTSSDSKTNSAGTYWTSSTLQNGNDGDYQSPSTPNPPATHHVCSGSCTEVARSCSWAYTGECMCTASSVPDPWGLFSPHGCAAVVKSQLGGRGLIEVGGNKTASSGGENASAAAYSNAIVQGAKGFYNASTGAQIACPCNSTCVSYGCCGSDGLIFAPKDRCLGKLDVA